MIRTVLAIGLFQLADAHRPDETGAHLSLAPETSALAFTEVEPGVWATLGPTSALTIRVDRGGLSVSGRDRSRLGAERHVTATLRTRAFGAAGGIEACTGTSISVSGARAELRHGRLSEWFVHRRTGVEHGWTVEAELSPYAAAHLLIEVELRGLKARIAEDGLSARFVDGAGSTRLNYEGLRAFDSAGNALAARLIATDFGLAVEVSTEGAIYPVTVDPLLTGPHWTAEGNQASSRFGHSVAGAGDVNGDGFSDVLVGAPSFSSGQSGEGRAYLYLGSAGGLGASPAWTAEIDQVSAEFGFSVAGAGDVNGDGFDDVIIGAQRASNGQHEEGRAFLYLGSGSGLSAAPQWSAESNLADAAFGWSVAGAGDVNGDGYDDVIVGAPGWNLGGGRAYLYLGSSTGLSPTAFWIASQAQGGENLGISVAGAGDVNGDGYDDVIIGAYFYSNGQAREGRADVYLGSAGALATSPVVSLESNQAESGFGWSVAGAGDVDGDGYDDVIVGAPWFDYSPMNDDGRVFLYRGSPSGPVSTPAWSATVLQTPTQPIWARPAFGSAVCGAGDINGDGYDDVVVGAPGYDSGQIDEGLVFLYTGSPNGLTATPVWRGEDANQFRAGYGNSVAAAGDVDADGNGDLVVAAQLFSADQEYEGRAYLYHGEALTVRGFCSGDGTAAACPCGNQGASGNGCANSVNLAGASLAWSGMPSVGNDTLVLLGSGMPDGAALYFQGLSMVSGGAGAPFGDGLLCVSGSTVRLGTQINAGGSSQYPSAGNQSVSVRGGVGVGDLRSYQAWYRNPAPFCTISTFNMTNGLEVRWAP